MNDLTQEQPTLAETPLKPGHWLGLGVGTFLISALMAIFGWKMYTNNQGPIDTGLAGAIEAGLQED